MNALQKFRGGVAMVRIIKDANRLDDVFNLLDNLADEETLTQVAQRFAESAAGRAGLHERVRLEIDLESLAAYPPGTLAHAFARHMRAHNLDPNAIPTLPSETESQWAAAHLYETHDLWHVVTGFSTDVAGELGLQAFYAAQVGSALPFALLAAGMMNTALYDVDDGRRRMHAVAAGWTLGHRAQSLLGIHWASLWAAPLEDVRRRFGLLANQAAAATH